MKKICIDELQLLDETVQNMLNTICSNLLLAGKDKRKIIVTSCHDGEGKTYMATRLAATLAQESYEVLLMDVDIRSSHITHSDVDDADTHKNIGDFLDDVCKYSDIVYTTDVMGLSVLPCSKIFSDNSGFIYMTWMPELLEKLSRFYDYIIIDTPSAGQRIEATKIASVCDGIVLVTRYNKTKKRDLSEVVNQLQKSGCPILGCIINKVKFDTILSRKRYRLVRTSLRRKRFLQKKE